MSDKTNRPLPALIAGLAIIMADGYDLQAIGFVAPEIARQWSLPLSDFAIIFSLGLVGTIPGAVLAGPLAKKFGHRRGLMLAMLVFGLGSLATALAGSISALAVLRAITGVGLGAAVPLVIVAVGQAAPAKRRATLVTLVMCGQPLGAILGAGLCSVLIPRLGWQAAFLLGGLAPLLLLPAARFLPGPDGRSEAGSAHRITGLFAPGLARTSIFLAVVAFLNIFVLYLIVNWLPGILRDGGFTLAQALTAISCFNGGGIAGIALMGWLIDRYGLFRVVPAAFLVGSMSIALLGMSGGDPRIVYVTAVCAGLAGYGAGASIGAMAVLLYPSGLQTPATGWALGVGRTGAAIGPLVVGALLSAGATSVQLFILAGLLTAAAALLVRLLDRQRAQARDSTCA